MKIKGWKKTEDKKSNFRGLSKSESIGKYVIKYENNKLVKSSVGNIPISYILIIPQKTKKGFKQRRYDIHLVNIGKMKKGMYETKRIFFKTKQKALNYSTEYMRSHPNG